MAVYTNPGDTPLLSAVSAVITGSARDCRHCGNYGLLFWQMPTATDPYDASAVANFEVSQDMTAWMIEKIVTATASLTGTAYLEGYYPYVRGNVTHVWYDTAKESATGAITLHWTPRVV